MFFVSHFNPCGVVALKPIIIVCVVLFVACGIEAQEEPCGGAYLAGTFTNVEVAALTDVIEAFEAVGLPEPCCLVTFIWAFDQPFRFNRT
jgi:hypothetical protein